MPTQPLRLAAIVAMSLFVAALMLPDSAAGSLSNAKIDKLRQVVAPAYRRGDARKGIKGLSPRVGGMTAGGGTAAAAG